MQSQRLSIPLFDEGFQLGGEALEILVGAALVVGDGLQQRLALPLQLLELGGSPLFLFVLGLDG